jgi:glycosyltransferase involved in cell wall biosynthesis
LLDTLTTLDDKYASKINLKLTMLDNTFDKGLLNKFKSVEIITGGYKHNQLKEIFNKCDLSIIPVVWEDNLPQIAIESIAFGVPVLCSNAGGAKELYKNNLFTFKAGDKEDLMVKIIYFLENKNKIDSF